MKQIQRIPTHVEFGKSALSAQLLDGHRAVIVHGASPASLAGLDAVGATQGVIEARALGSVQDVCDLAGSLDPQDVDMIVGIGGGAVIDKAKKLGGVLRDAGAQIGIVATPTLPGSGVEASKAVVINEDRKIIEASDSFLPDQVIYDYRLIAQAGLGRLLDGAYDAAVQGLESLFSAFANPVSTAMAHGALGKFHQITTVLSAGADLSDRALLKLVPEFCSLSFAGGLAQSEAGAGPIHAMAHSVETTFGGGHARLVRAIARRAITQYVEAARTAHEAAVLAMLADDFAALTALEAADVQPILSAAPTDIFLERMRADPCWRTSKVRFRDAEVHDILSGA